MAAWAVQIFGRLHIHLCNVLLFLVPKVQLQIKVTKARPSFYLMNKTADTKTTFTFLVTYLMVRRVQTNPLILSANETTLENGALARYNMTSFNFKIFTSRTVLYTGPLTMQAGPLHKRLLFTMIKNSDFNGSVDTHPYKFRHDFSEF